MGFVDLHAHFLPGIDDGAPDLATGLAILRGLEALGYERVTATPHQYAGRYLPSYEQIDTAFAQVSAAAGAGAIGLGLSLAAENMWDEVFLGRIQDASFRRYDGGQAFLFELRPNDSPIHFEQTIFQLQVKGLRPVLAHPERYVALWDDDARVQRLADAGVALVVDLAALAGFHGGKQAKAARRLVERRLAHAAASDCHCREDLPQIEEGLSWLRKKMGLAELTRLCDENPRRILAGQGPE
jgi:protein-tyrosine phosphatase